MAVQDKSFHQLESMIWIGVGSFKHFIYSLPPSTASITGINSILKWLNFSNIDTIYWTIEKSREGQENNIIISREQESKKEDPAECKDDMTFFDSLCCEALDMGKVEVDSITRLGKKDKTKTRPLKFNMANAEDKQKIFKRLRRLKEADVRFQVSVPADLPLQDCKLIQMVN